MDGEDQKGPLVGDEATQPDAIMGDNDNGSSSSGFNDDDPRLQLLFSQEPPSRPYQASEYAPPEDDASPELDIDEHAILNCWEWSVQQHSQTNMTSAWVAPNEVEGAFDDAPDDETENPYRNNNATAAVSLSHWEPQSLQLPAWAIPNVPNNDENA